MRKTTPKTGQKASEINPFSQALVIETRYRYSRTTVGLQEIGLQEVKTLVEAESRTQLYHNHTFKVFKLLSNNSKLLFMWIATKIGWGSEKIELRSEKVCEATGFSTASFYRALDELKTYAVITESTSRDKTYWFNPILFFNGDRIKTFPGNVQPPKL